MPNFVPQSPDDLSTFIATRQESENTIQEALKHNEQEALLMLLEGQQNQSINDEDDLELDELLVNAFCGFEPEDVAAQLETIKTTEMPQIFKFATEIENDIKELSPDDQKIFDRCQQVLNQGRKSGKYFELMQELLQRYPENETLTLMTDHYLKTWHPGQALNFQKQQIENYPQKRLLRFIYASESLLMIEDPEKMSEAEKAQFLNLMQHKLSLHAHFHDRQPNSEEAEAFYRAMGAYYLMNQEPEQAIYAINLLSHLALIKNEEPSSILDTFLQFLFLYLLESDYIERLQCFMRPLWSKRSARQEPAFKA